MFLNIFSKSFAHLQLEVNKDSEQDRRDRVADERYKEEKAQLTVEVMHTHIHRHANALMY